MTNQESKKKQPPVDEKKSTEKKVIEEQPTEKTSPEKKKFPIKKTLGIIAGSIVVLILLIIVGYFIYEYTYQDKIYPGVTLNNEDMSGKTYSDITSEINTYKASLDNTGLNFSYEEKEYSIKPQTKDEESGDIMYLVNINTDETAQAIYGIGRSDDEQTNLKNKVSALFGGYDVTPNYSVDKETLIALLSNEFSEFEQPDENAKLSFSENGEIQISDHKDGYTFDWESYLDEVESNLNSFEPVNIKLELTANPAPITTETAENMRTEIEAISDLSPITLTYEDQTFEIESEEFNSWLMLTENGVSFDEELVDSSLDTIAGKIDIPVKEGRFSLDIVNDVVELTQFEEGADGLEVNIEKTITEVNASILDNKQSKSELIVEVTTPRVTPGNLNELGVKEILGTGTTSFAGSPYNRIGNIQKGADLLNGLLIAPGETFSLMKLLSPVDIAHGWLSELVIKGDKLEKEAGGGLCQIGTTVFRATMMSGLEVVERRNHSWAVSYYNYNGKAGVDATIYEPSPDYKFKNDTENYILIRSRIEGSDIYFEFWGTSDGRKGSFTEPTNYGYVYPGPTEEIVDPSLPPGARNCPTHAFTGVSASFDYIIERPDGSIDTTNYTSVYKSRSAVCMVGPEAEKTPTEETTQDITETVDTTTPVVTPEVDVPTETTKDTTKKDTTKKKKKN
ncbi:MAG: VanW family protein [bacterium]|nr:VanW family protein [bacterium]